MSEVDFDVVVAGAGAAGRAAALAAAERGASVLVAESHETFRAGSNTAMSTSMIPAAGTRWQREAGVEDSPATFLGDVLAKTGGDVDATVARTLTEIGAELVEWLVDRWGVPLELVTDFVYPGHSVARCHAVADRSGRTLHGHLLRALQSCDEATLAVPMRLERVVERDGAVTGAVVSVPGREEEVVTAGAVVLATNGYAGRPDLVARHCPDIAGARYFGGDGAVGTALEVGEALGADTAYLDAYQGHGSVADPHGVILTWAAIMHGAIVVDSGGARFGDETTGYSEYARLVLARPGGHAWVVLDERIERACQQFADFRDLVAAGALRAAEDVGALSALVGADVAPALAEAAAAADGDAPDPHGRTAWEAPLAPPFRAVRVTGALFHTQGGLCVDSRAAVLRDGRPVPGLYAAGGAAVGMSGHGPAGYLAGNGLLAALGLGLLAGRSAPP